MFGTELKTVKIVRTKLKIFIFEKMELKNVMK